MHIPTFSKYFILISIYEKLILVSPLDCKKYLEEMLNKAYKESLDCISSHLLPCPFCEGSAEIYVTKHTPKGFAYTPRCKKSSCCGRITKKFPSKELAIDHWNTRSGDN